MISFCVLFFNDTKTDNRSTIDKESTTSELSDRTRTGVHDTSSISIAEREQQIKNNRKELIKIKKRVLLPFFTIPFQSF